MSRELGKKTIDRIVNEVLHQSDVWQALSTNYREELNSQYHILDLRQSALQTANGASSSSRVFQKAYIEFIRAIETDKSITKYQNLDALEKFPGRTCYIRDPGILVSTSFKAARKRVTEVSKKIPNNPYFGISNRVRSLPELLSEGYTIEDLAKDGRVFDTNTGVELLPGTTQPRVRELSLVDLGHTPAKELGRDSPLSTQFEALSAQVEVARDFIGPLKPVSNIAEIKKIAEEDRLAGKFLEHIEKTSLVLPQASGRIFTLVQASLDKLFQIQAKADVTFKNDIPSTLKKLSGTKGFLSLTLQLYTVNNDISVKESAIRNKLIRDIKAALLREIRRIPGSNTIDQDILEYVSKSVVSSLSGKPQGRLKPHDLVGSSTKNSYSKPAKTTSSKVTLSKPAKSPSKPTQLRNVRGQFYSLASLQNLLNSNLVQKVRENMGDGTRRDILNLRTGRFAESVKVERMSQSREGMITAFYTYMRNPYGTFSEGGAQGLPRSRDPKLLISKSIREIAATQVANRMRAVLA